ncbi:glutamine amidotransferase [Pelagicoccus enzymogenes]|uniref:glutamine amidotransferase n=1 Tax=Pelagicoccus enzymogenes TaxID=2773457 RepID=UPI00280D1ADC|nr:glutamine amidotransferase [Pelagicoccus enzymogenes]MDQ8200616.1 glutamine amidotransferase [Pelagicoccus enzymogenes]
MVFASNLPWLAFAIALVVLLPMAWLSWKGSLSRNRNRWLALALRFLGILFIAFAIADPQVTSERPVQGANIVALLADNGKSLSIKEPSSERARGEELRDLLTQPSQSWPAKLKDNFQLRNYLFDSQVRRTSSFENLNFEGEQSAISTSLRGLGERLENKPVAGIVLFSDGNSTDLELSQEELSKLPPVYPVLIGEDGDVTDLSIQELTVKTTAFGDTPVSVSAKLLDRRSSEGPVKIQLRRLDSRRESTAMPYPDLDERSVKIEGSFDYVYEWSAPGGGTQFFELSAYSDSPEAQEATLDNNRQLFAVDRGKENYRILYVTGRPNWEYKFLNRALSADAQLDLVGLLRVASREPKFDFKSRAGENSNALYRGFGREDETERYDEAVLIRMNARDANELKTGFPDEAEELFAYDALIIDDLEADFFSFSQQTLIRDFAKRRGGGLLMLGGVNALEDGNYQNTPIAQALPLYLDGGTPPKGSDQRARWELTRNGWVEPWVRIRAFETEERMRIQEMPSFRVFNSSQRIKPGAQSLATIEDLSTETYPALVTHRFGLGRVATLTVGDFWRWGMQSPSTQADLAQFWRQISRWLVKDTPDRVELSAGPIEGSTITLKANARQEDYNSLTSGIARLTVRRLDAASEKREYEMNIVSDVQGQFYSELALKESGAYLAEVTVTGFNGEVIGTAETGWVYQPLVKEFTSLSPNKATLERLAEGTGGRLLRSEDLERLPELLATQSSPVMEIWSEPLWHRNWLFILALTSFLAEWLLRRKGGLA